LLSEDLFLKEAFNTIDYGGQNFLKF